MLELSVEPLNGGNNTRFFPCTGESEFRDLSLESGTDSNQGPSASLQ